MKIQRYQWEDRERFYLEDSERRIYLDPHGDYYPEMTDEDIIQLASGFSIHSEIIIEWKTPSIRNPYLKCIRCSRSIPSVRKRPDLYNASICDRCLGAMFDESPASTYYEILPDGTKGKVL